MPNFNKYLPNDEEVLEIIHSVKISLYFKLSVATIIFLAPFFLMIPILSLGIKGIVLSLLIIFLDLIYILKSYNKWTYNCIILTEKKLYRFHQEGILKRGIKEFYLDNIDEINVEYRGLISKVFKVGDLVIYLKNDNYIDLDDVADIQRVKNRIWELRS
jgi:Bacterial PH domain